MASPVSLLKNSRVPDRAMVPRLAIGLVATHPDAVVDDRQAPGGAIDGDTDPEFAVALVDLVVVDREEAQLVAGVRSIGDQFAQEDLAVAVEGMDHQIQQLPDLGLEAEGLFVCGGHG